MCAAARPTRHWRQRDSLVAEATCSFGDAAMAREVSESYPLSVGLQLAQAPAAFARPMVQRKLCRPCFRVRPAGALLCPTTLADSCSATRHLLARSISKGRTTGAQATFKFHQSGGELHFHLPNPSC